MDNHDLLTPILGALSPASLQTLAQQIGAPPQQTASAVGVALPVLLGALSRNASQPGGAQALHAALQRDHSGVDVGRALSGALGGGGAGAAILDHILGQRQGKAASTVSQASGLDPSQSTRLMAMLAPLVMAALGARTQQAGLDPRGLGGLLTQLGAQLSGTGLGGALMNAVLDKDGDGDVDLSDLLVATQGGQAQGGLGGLLGAFFGGRPDRR
jgi:hypothetical protein